MTDSGKRSLEQIVSEAQTLPPEERLRFIREACASDAAAFDTVLSELRSRHEWFDAVEQVSSGTFDLGPDPAGQLIGPYRVVRLLGAGGMGTVFQAERADDQFRQQVAIKLVRHGLLSRGVRNRLRQERQILASLDHPNIARLYDGGSTAEGVPYIVMEYVDGERIDTYCDRERLTIEQRLQLFITVCSAVHRAHQNLIVHRDLKPSNILVTAEGQPKLLDFGIAKLLDDRDMMHTLAVTQADVRIMTPDHASPEQIRGDLISTASDIYVLGVLLYELLSGYRPFVIKGNRLAELERAICEDMPPSLVAAVESAGDTPGAGIAEIAQQRSTTVSKLKRRLRGDLNNIVMMAMRKEPSRRYSSVQQFVADIENFLADMPVLARADAWTYRSGKFVQRHFLVVALSLAFVALLIGFSATTLVQSKRIAHERDVATAERARAQEERARAEAVSTFLVDSFRLADPSQSRGKQITALEILQTGAERISRELRNQPALQATLLDTIGTVYLGLDQAEDAKPLIEQGLAIRRKLSDDSLDVARSLYSLNRVYELQGDWTTSEALARESLALNEKLTGATSLETAGSLCALGYVLKSKGELENAELNFSRCLEIRTRILGKQDQRLAAPLDNLAQIAQQRDDHARAENLLRQALAIVQENLGEDHPQYIHYLRHLAEVLQDRGNFREAEELYRRSLDLYRQVLGPDHADTIDAMSSFGNFLIQTGRLDEAQTLLQSVLAADRRLRPQHTYVGNDLENLGRVAFRKHQYAEAGNYFREALTIYNATLAPDSGFIATAWTLLGWSLLEQQRMAEAEAALAKAIESWQVQYSKTTSPGFAMARAVMAQVWALRGDHAKAEAALTESYPVILKSTRSTDRDNAVTVRRWIEELYRSMNRPQAAQIYFQQLGGSPPQH
jgi:serine/threonine protein kinase/tetratricopeptide (TPR) repeat protein